MSLSNIINQINNLTGYNIPSASGVIISSSQQVGSGSVNDIINYINSITGYNVPNTNVQFVSGSNISGPVVVYTPFSSGDTISTEGILPGRIIRAEHVLRIIYALSGITENTIIISGSFLTSGSNVLNGTLSLPFIDDEKFLYVSGGYVVGLDLPPSASYAISSSYSVSSSFATNALTASYFTGSVSNADFATVAGLALAGSGSFSGSFSGSGANLSNIPASAIIGLNLSQISSGSYSASISEEGLLVNNRVVADSFTGSLFGTASWAENYNETDPIFTAVSGTFATTASFNSFTSSYYQDSASFDTRTLDNSSSITLLSASFESFSGSYNTGSFTGAFSGSLYGTASWAENFDEIDPVFTAVSGTFATTSSFNSFTSSYYQDSSSFNSRIVNNSSSIATLSSSFTSFSSSYNTGSFTGQFSGSFSGSGANLFGIPASGIIGLNLSQISSGSFSASISDAGLLVNNRVVAPSFTGSLFGTASWASNALTASHVNTLSQNVTVVGNQTISGSLLVRDNLVVLGSASIQYISESTLNIGTNLITVNTFDGSIRFGGLAVIDSGSSPQVSGSFLFDSVKDQFIFVHQTTPITSSVFLLGPETYNDLGNEAYLTQNRLPKGSGIEHLYDSNISDNGSVVSINSNTQVTGSLIVSQGVTASLFGTASWARNALTASRLDPLNLNLSVPPADGDLLIYNTDTSAWENSKTLSGSYVLSGSFTTNGENIVCGSLIITNNSVISGSLVVGNNLTVFGDSTLLNLTSSQVDIGTSILTLNVFSPAVRYGGLRVYDTGSTPAPGSGSLLYDTFSKDWIVVDGYGAGVTSSVVLVGPQTFNNEGSEIYLTANRLPKGTGTEHLNDSNISDNGSIVSINSNTQVTGSLVVSAGISGSFSGSGANLFGIPASGIVGLNLSQISSGSVSASISPNNGLQVNTNVTATSFTGSLLGTATTASIVTDAARANTNFQQIFLLMGG